MNIHEYQAKALLRSYGAPVSDGRAVLKAEDAKTAVKMIIKGRYANMFWIGVISITNVLPLVLLIP